MPSRRGVQKGREKQRVGSHPIGIRFLPSLTFLPKRPEGRGYISTP